MQRSARASLQAALLLLAVAWLRVCAAAGSCQLASGGSEDSGDSRHNDAANDAAIRGLALSELAIVSEPMTLGGILRPSASSAFVAVACRLKGRPSGGSGWLRVRLPPGSDCADRPDLVNSVGRFVFLLRRGSVGLDEPEDAWHLLDGGLYSAADFYRRFRLVCDGVRVYSGSCHGNETGDRVAGPHAQEFCATFDLMLDVLGAGETPPYNDAARRPRRLLMHVLSLRPHAKGCPARTSQPAALLAAAVTAALAAAVRGARFGARI